jgi:hypothetical protein
MASARGGRRRSPDLLINYRRRSRIRCAVSFGGSRGTGPHKPLATSRNRQNSPGIPAALSRGSSAGLGFTVSRGRHLNGELGLVIAPNGDILTVNGGNGNLVEVTPFGAQIAVRRLDSSGGPPPGAGALFGLAVKPGHDAVYYVDDATNTLNLLHQ